MEIRYWMIATGLIVGSLIGMFLLSIAENKSPVIEEARDRVRAVEKMTRKYTEEHGMRQLMLIDISTGEELRKSAHLMEFSSEELYRATAKSLRGEMDGRVAFFWQEYYKPGESINTYLSVINPEREVDESTILLINQADIIKKAKTALIGK